MRKWECTVCGYIHTGDEPPDECPVCSADKSMFVEIFDEAPKAETATKPARETASPSAAQSTALPPALAKALAIATDLTTEHHLHPIMVHTPNGVVPMAMLFLLITAFLGFPLFETAAFYSLVFVLITMPAVLFTGYIMWQNRYRGAMTSIFKIKIGASAVATLLLLILTIWRAAQPTIITTPTGGRWLFLMLAGLLLAAIGLAGHMGGKLVFGARKN